MSSSNRKGLVEKTGALLNKTKQQFEETSTHEEKIKSSKEKFARTIEEVKKLKEKIVVITLANDNAIDQKMILVLNQIDDEIEKLKRFFEGKHHPLPLDEIAIILSQMDSKIEEAKNAVFQIENLRVNEIINTQEIEDLQSIQKQSTLLESNRSAFKRTPATSPSFLSRFSCFSCCKKKESEDEEKQSLLSHTFKTP